MLLRVGLSTQYAVPLRVGLPIEHAAPLRAGLPIQYITMQYDTVQNAKRNTTLHYGKRLEYTIIHIHLQRSYWNQKAMTNVHEISNYTAQCKGYNYYYENYQRLRQLLPWILNWRWTWMLSLQRLEYCACGDLNTGLVFGLQSSFDLPILPSWCCSWFGMVQHCAWRFVDPLQHSHSLVYLSLIWWVHGHSPSLMGNRSSKVAGGWVNGFTKCWCCSGLCQHWFWQEWRQSWWHSGQSSGCLGCLNSPDFTNASFNQSQIPKRHILQMVERLGQQSVQ